MRIKRTFRRFWPLELGKPLLQAVGLSALIVVITFSIFPRLPWLLGLILVPFGWFYGRFLIWRNNGCTFDGDDGDVDDIKLRISPQAFDRVVSRYLLLKLAQPVRRRKMPSGDLARWRSDTTGEESDKGQAGLDAAA